MISNLSFKNAVTLSHHIAASVLGPGDTVVDACCGRGRDTLFLAELVGRAGRVYAFDIQKEAIEATYDLLEKNHLLEQVSLFNACHTMIDQYVLESIQAAMFNLGYLPGGNQAIKTQPHSTLEAVKKCINILAPGGIITLVFYPGHPGGQEEMELVKDYLIGLPQASFEVLKIDFVNQINNPPLLLVVQKLEES